MGVDALPHDYGVIHQYAQHHDEAEEGDGVYGIAHQMGQEEGAQEGNRHAHAHPEGEPRPKEESQQQQHHEEALAAGIHEGGEPVVQQHGIVVPHGQRHLRRQAMLHILDVLAHRAGDFADVLVAHPGNAHQRRRLAVEAQRLVGVRKAVHHPRDIAQMQAGAVGPGGHQQVFELMAPVGLALGAQQDFPGAGLDGAARQVQGAAPHRLRDLREGEAIAPQGHLGNLYGDFIVAGVLHRGLGDARQAHYVVADFPCEFLQGPLVAWPGYSNVQHIADAGHQAGDGLFGLLREGVYGVHPVLHLVQRPHVVGVLEELHRHLAEALVRIGADALHALYAGELFLYAHADALFGFLRRRAQVGHGDADDRDFQIREGLERDLVEGDGAGKNDEAHQQVGGHMVPAEPGDDGLHEEATPGLSTGRTRIPWTALLRVERHTVSPVLKPPLMYTCSPWMRRMSTSRNTSWLLPSMM